MLNSCQTLDIIRFLQNESCEIPLNEDAQITSSEYVLDKIFSLTVGKYSKIDFNEIAYSRGDVTKCKFYKNLRECIDELVGIHTITNRIPGAISISTALNNIAMGKKTYEQGFREKNNMAILIYNTIYYAIMEATSYMIAYSLNFIKTGDIISVNVIEMDNKDTVLLDSLDKFNKSCENGTIYKFLDGVTENLTNECVDYTEPLTEGIVLDTGKKVIDWAAKGLFNNGKYADGLNNLGKGLVITAAVGGLVYLASHIIPILREMMYVIYNLRHKISQTAQIQADLLSADIEIIKVTKNARDGNVDKIIAKQQRNVDHLMSISNTFSIDMDKSERDANIAKTGDKIDTSELII